MRFIGFYNYTVLLTYMSLASAVVGLYFTSIGNCQAAVLCIILSGICDIFDGVVARSKKDRTQDQKNFGIQIDSLTDVIAFGVLPAAVYYCKGVNSVLGICILVLYIMCGVIRLAYFNVLETKRQADPDASACAHEFRGLPITFSAIITPIVCAVAWLIPTSVAEWVFYIAPLFMGFMFVLDVKIPKIDIGALLLGRK